MNGLFWRLYLAIGVSQVVAVLLWALVASQGMWGEAEDRLAVLVGGPLTELASTASASADPAETVRSRSEVWGWPVAIADDDAVDEALREGARTNGRALAVTSDGLFAVVPMEGGWLTVGPWLLLPRTGRVRWLLLGLASVAGVGTASWLVLRGVHQDLVRMQAAARRIAQGELSSRCGVQDGPAGDLGRTFDAMAERVERVLELQRDTLQGVSHELRTPLTRARFGVELLADADDPEDRERALTGVGRDLDQAERLLGELLQWMRAESGHLALAREPVALGPLAAEVVLEEGRDRPTIRATTTGDGTVRGDPTLVRRALRNLVANALRAARTEVMVTVAPVDGGFAIDVDDDGPGLGPDPTQWFRPFHRGADARDVDPDGVGLGLPLVHRIAVAHEGRVEPGTSPLGGARMRLVLPAHERSQKSAESPRTVGTPDA